MIRLFTFTIPLIAIAILTHSVANAQDWAPDPGSRTLEVHVSPFSSSPVSFNHFSFQRYFDSNRSFRVRGDFNTTFSSTSYENVRDDDITHTEDRESMEFDLTLRPGIFRHIFSDNRMIPYFGIELPVGFSLSQFEREQTDFHPTQDLYVERNRETVSHTYRVGLNIRSGLDFFILENLYTGIEVGYGIRFDYQTENRYSERIDTDGSTRDDESKSTNSQLRSSLQNIANFRLGFVF